MFGQKIKIYVDSFSPDLGPDARMKCCHCAFLQNHLLDIIINNTVRLHVYGLTLMSGGGLKQTSV